ncbi:hypothetical protein EDD11_009092 [Mortierella claussenii]|nr:hypothetical protein EDD11_009092 [Mortierella claussenii]
METADISAELTQAFQACAASNLLPLSPTLVEIDTHHDRQTGERIILWKNVQLFFKTAYCVMDGARIVPFMTDEATFEDLLPLRIKYRPGVVLKVVLPDSESTTSSSHASSASTASATISIDSNNSSDSYSFTTINSGAEQIQASIDHAVEDDHDLTSKQLELLSISEAAAPAASNDDDHSLVVMSSNHLSGEARSSMQRLNRLYDDFRQAFAANQAHQVAAIAKEATKVMDVMNEQFGQQRADSEEIKTLQSAAMQMQREMMQMQQQMDKKQEAMDKKQEAMLQLQKQMDKKQEEIDRKQEEMLHMQRQTLDRLAVIQNRVQAVLTQTYELHEYPIPRLFIVLPKATLRHRDRWGKPFAKQFRLFFLCECGAHTQTPGSKVPHTIHLARHEGYDLDRPSVFFEKYGTYVLTLLQMIKYGVVASKIVVPALASLDLAQWLDSVKDIVDAHSDGLEGLVDHTITYIQDQQKPMDQDGVITEGEADQEQQLDKLEVMEGADLRRLEQYLKVRDEGRVLGNLYRIVTQEGHVKWVCIDHYRDNYQQSSMQQLKEMVELNRGTLIEQEGKITISLSSSMLARQFYDVVVKTRGIQDLDITFGWDATFQDLRDFESAMTKANIVRLVCNGNLLKGPGLDVINRRRRFDPLVQLMCNGRIQSIAFFGFSDFFTRITTSSMTKTPRLRYLSLTHEEWISRPSLSAFKALLACCPRLTELSLSNLVSGTTLDTLLGDKPEVLKTLKSSSLRLQDASFDTTFSEGKVVELIAMLFNLNTVYDTYWASLPSGHITKLEIKEGIAEQHQGRLADLIRLNPVMEEIEFSNSERCSAILDLVISTRKKMLATGGSDGCALIKMSFKNWRSSLEVTFSNTSQLDSMSIMINLAAMDARYLSELPSIFLQYGSFIVHLDASSNLDRPMAESFAKAIALHGSTLHKLTLGVSSCPTGSMEPMSQVIERSSGLEYFSFELVGSISDHERSVAQWWLDHYGRKTTQLTMVHDWTQLFFKELSGHFPNKSALPNLSTLSISDRRYRPDNDEYMDPYVQWVVSMLTAAEPSPSGLTSSQVSLKDISLTNVSLGQERWAQIIKAIDVMILERLDVQGSDFSFEELQLLNECMCDVTAKDGYEEMALPLTNLALWETPVASMNDIEPLKKVMAELKDRAPMLSIWGTHWAPSFIEQYARKKVSSP